MWWWQSATRSWLPILGAMQCSTNTCNTNCHMYICNWYRVGVLTSIFTSVSRVLNLHCGNNTRDWYHYQCFSSSLVVEVGVALHCRQQRVSDCRGGVVGFIHTTTPFILTTKWGNRVMGCHFMLKVLPDLWPSSRQDKDPILATQPNRSHGRIDWTASL